LKSFFTDVLDITRHAYTTNLIAVKTGRPQILKNTTKVGELTREIGSEEVRYVSKLGFKIFKIHFYGRFPAASVTAVLEFKKRGASLSAISFIPAKVAQAL
jgi:hypothetical protein